MTAIVDGTLHARRLESWRQTPESHVPDADAAAELLDRVGIATLFPASPEVPNLFHAYAGDPEAKTDAKWDSPAGRVFGWRWDLGRKEAAFYSIVVRNRPTWVSWALLPAVLRLRGEVRTPDELYDLGTLSAGAYRIAQALEEAGGVLSTGELRAAASFPTGKEHRAAYLKAVDELDRRLLLAKVFSCDDLEMRHALVSARYPEHVAVAERMTREEAVDRFLRTYLPAAVYAVPSVLAKHLGVPEAELVGGLERCAPEGRVAVGASSAGTRFVWEG